jgi:hypothetical protein
MDWFILSACAKADPINEEVESIVTRKIVVATIVTVGFIGVYNIFTLFIFNFYIKIF